MSIFNTLRNLFAPQPRCITEQAPGSASDTDHEEACAQSCDRRDAYWAKVGTVEQDVLGHLISPALMGGSAWPTTRQAYRVIRRPNTIILSTDGMSDPFEERESEGNGFGMELFVETSQILPDHAGKLGDVSQLPKSWAFEIISHVASTVADAGGIASQLKKYGVMSMELPGVSQSNAIGAQVPSHYVTADDCVGVLLGVPTNSFPTRIEDMPLSPVTMVAITLISAEELENLREGGAAARKKLVRKLAQSGRHHVIAPNR